MLTLVVAVISETPSETELLIFAGMSEIELEEGLVTHREGARRMNPKKFEACKAVVDKTLKYAW